jgi:hypothetical protein
VRRAAGKGKGTAAFGVHSTSPHHPSLLCLRWNLWYFRASRGVGALAAFRKTLKVAGEAMSESLRLHEVAATT